MMKGKAKDTSGHGGVGVGMMNLRIRPWEKLLLVEPAAGASAGGSWQRDPKAKGKRAKGLQSKRQRAA